MIHRILNGSLIAAGVTMILISLNSYGQVRAVPKEVANPPVDKPAQETRRESKPPRRESAPPTPRERTEPAPRAPSEGRPSRSPTQEKLEDIDHDRRKWERK